ncbi:MAG TPA: ABC transporter permease [Vicinamibacterales bacterium]
MTRRHLRTRLSSLFRRSRLETELDVELQYHIDMLVEQNVAAGMRPAEARQAALRTFGAVQGIKDDVRDTWLSHFVETLSQDIRYGVRNLRRNPGFAFVVMLTMALGIGANTAIFSVVNGVLLRPLPYRDGDKLVVLRHGVGDTVANDLNFSVKDLNDYRQARSISDIVEFHNMFFTLLGRHEAERVSTGVVSSNFFDVLGVQPVYGRTFVAADEAHGAPAVLVLSHKYWQRSFGGDPKIVGQVFRMNDRPHTVVGVLPPVPQYPLEVDVYMPTSACPFRSRQALIDNRQGRMVTAFGRIKPEVTLSKSRADLDIMAVQLAKSYPDDYPQNGYHITATPLKEDLTRNFKVTLLILLGTAGFVLLIVCASIANLLLARMVKREREISVRAALGASRVRLLRQMLTESLLLAVSGGLVGLLFAAATLELLVAFAEGLTTRAGEISLDTNVLLFTLVTSVLTGLIFGSIPAFSSRTDMAPALRDGGRTTHASQGLRNTLIVAQVAASFMLLIASGLTLRSLIKLQNVNPGFQTENLLTVRADMSFNRFPLSLPRDVRSQKMATYWAEYEEKLKAMPGVTQVGGGGTFPLNEAPLFTVGFQPESRPLPAGQQPPQVDFFVASPEYFTVLGQPIVAGRAFTASDTVSSQQVVIINQSTARHYWPNENPIGKRVQGNGPHQMLTVVGVTADVRQQLDRAPHDEVYLPLYQLPFLNTTWVVHSTLPIDQITKAIKTTSLAHDPELPVSQFRTLAEVRSSGLEPRRITTSLIGMFGLLALLITAAGIAGVVAFSVNQRTQEFGIRMALGAPRTGVLGMVLRQGLQLVAIGLVIGMAGAILLTRLLTTLLFQVEPTDALTFLAVSTVLLMVAVVACLMPARRAASVDPIVALRAL